MMLTSKPERTTPPAARSFDDTLQRLDMEIPESLFRTFLGAPDLGCALWCGR